MGRMGREGPHIQQDLPGFFWREHLGNEWRHVGLRTSIVKNPIQLTIRPGSLPGCIREIPLKHASKARDFSETFSSFPWYVTRSTAAQSSYPPECFTY